MDILDKLLYNLQTIANIPKGRRISTAKEFIRIDTDSPFQGIWRWKRVDSRDKAMQAIGREVRTVIVISKYIMESHLLTCADARFAAARDERINELKKIHHGLLEANRGIDNICQTYHDDANIGASLKPLIGEISGCLTAISIALAASAGMG